MCPEATMQLLDAPSNTYSGLRIINASHDWGYFEFRPSGDSPITHAATNWTELYVRRRHRDLCRWLRASLLTYPRARPCCSPPQCVHAILIPPFACINPIH